GFILIELVPSNAYFASITDSPDGLNLAQSSNVLSPEGNDQVGDEKKQSACHRTVSRSSTKLPNDTKCEDAEGKS
ncbi:hypothetical protein H5410_004357, partial [Solanum commersonii]